MWSSTHCNELAGNVQLNASAKLYNEHKQSTRMLNQNKQDMTRYAENASARIPPSSTYLDAILKHMFSENLYFTLTARVILKPYIAIRIYFIIEMN